MKTLRALYFLAASIAASQAQAAGAEPLTLAAAVAIALQSEDPSVLTFEEEARALESRAVEESQLPDPQVGLTLQNLPTSIDFNQADMTQAQISLRQSFPAGHTLSLRGERRRAESQGARHRAALERLEIALETRLSWLEMFYWAEAMTKIEESRQSVAELEEATRADYAAGRGTSQSLMRTRLEISLLEDRLIEAERQLDIARADLARYVGEGPARRPLPPNLPALRAPEPIGVLRDGLVRHPAVAREEALIEARRRDIEIAEEQYKPDWAVLAGYGFRDNRDDFITVGVTLDLPIFTGNRQDQAVNAARRGRQAALFSKDGLLLELRRRLERDYAAFTQLEARVGLYERSLIERARQTTEASFTSYRSGVTDFAELIRARLAELDAELELARLRVDRAQARTRLLFLEGEK